MISGKSFEWYKENCTNCPHACLVETYRDVDGIVYEDWDCCNECEEEGETK